MATTSTTSSQLAGEKIVPIDKYPLNYNPKGIPEQTDRLRELFPVLGYVDERSLNYPLPNGAEEWFAIPRWQKVALTYADAVQIVLNTIEKTRNGKFYNDREGFINAERFRQSSKTAEMFQILSRQQKHPDILVVPCQFGLRHCGRSVRQATEFMGATEFGLDTFSIGIMLLTHPERLGHHNDPWVDCAGDEFSDGGYSFDLAPFFKFHGFFGEVELGAGNVVIANSNFGSASAFLP